MAHSTSYILKAPLAQGILALWWIDGCNQYRLGWYKDGELTSVREEATVVEFAGISADLAWRLSGHPSTLPRLDCSRLRLLRVPEPIVTEDADPAVSNGYFFVPQPPVNRPVVV